MADSQDQNKPELNKDFQQAHSNEQKKEQLKRDIVSKMESQKLEQQRETPDASPQPNPPGGAAHTREYQVASMKREQRIKEIKERMDEAQQRLREGFDNSRGQG